DGNKILYSISPVHTPISSIEITFESKVMASAVYPSDSSLECAFCIQTKGSKRVWYLCADSRDICRGWIRIIECIIGEQIAAMEAQALVNLRPSCAPIVDGTLENQNSSDAPLIEKRKSEEISPLTTSPQSLITV